MEYPTKQEKQLFTTVKIVRISCQTKEKVMTKETNWKEIENADNVRVFFKDGEVWEGDASYLDITDEGDTLAFWFKGKPYTLMLSEIDYCERIK